jgi:hypothetical protein
MTEITNSGILPRTDKPGLSSKVKQRNEIFNHFAFEINGAIYLDHNTIDSTCLNSRGLHLNRKGTSSVISNSITCR